MKFKTIAYAALIAAASAAFVIGSGGSSEAKGKKKMAAAPPEPGPCFIMGGPVCGAKGGMKFTYANSCYAAKDGASVVSKGACHFRGREVDNFAEYSVASIDSRTSRL